MIFFFFWCYMYPEFFMNFLHILEGWSFGLQSYIVCLKMFKLSTFFNSAGKSFQRIAPIVLQSQNQILLVRMFCQFTETVDLTLLELFSLKLRLSLIMGGERSIFTLYISVSKCFIMNRNQFIKMMNFYTTPNAFSCRLLIRLFSCFVWNIHTK